MARMPIDLMYSVEVADYKPSADPELPGFQRNALTLLQTHTLEQARELAVQIFDGVLFPNDYANDDRWNRVQIRYRGRRIAVYDAEEIA